MDQEDERDTTIKSQDARQGEIILRSKRRRAIFIAGLVAFTVVAIVASWIGS